MFCPWRLRVSSTKPNSDNWAIWGLALSALSALLKCSNTWSWSFWESMSIKSTIITPAIFRIRSCLAISVAASQFVHNTVSLAVAERVNEPELTSTTVKASVGSIIT